MVDAARRSSPGCSTPTRTAPCTWPPEDSASTRCKGEAEQTPARLTELDAENEQRSSAATITRFADTWPALSVDARRDVAGALLTSVRVNPDKTVELFVRWSAPVTVKFEKRGRLPVLPVLDDAS